MVTNLCSKAPEALRPRQPVEQAMAGAAHQPALIGALWVSPSAG